MTQPLRCTRRPVLAGSAAVVSAAIPSRPAKAAPRNRQENLKMTGDRIDYAVKTES
jgi:hypothetical protein